MNNPIQLINLLKGKISPKELCLNMIGNNTNPLLKNLLEMANKGDTQGVENFARNVFKEKGLDFDKEMNNFMSNFK